MFTQTQALESGPICRPGERLVYGRPYVFNMDLLRLHEAHEAVQAALGADLSAMSYEDLTGLLYSCQTVTQVRRGNGGLPYELRWEDANALCARVAGERSTRPEYVVVYARRSTEVEAA